MFDALLTLLGGTMALAFLALPVWLLAVAAHRLGRRWQGGWAIAAWAPLALPVGDGVVILAAVARDPTAHNLWPLELAFVSIGAGALLALIAAAHWLVAR